MLCTFTTPYGSLIVRSEDIRLIQDVPDDSDESYVYWMLGDEVRNERITGTARENRDRIQQEELDLIARVEVHRYENQRRLSEGYPVPSVKRGK